MKCLYYISCHAVRFIIRNNQKENNIKNWKKNIFSKRLITYIRVKQSEKINQLFHITK